MINRNCNYLTLVQLLAIVVSVVWTFPSFVIKPNNPLKDAQWITVENNKTKVKLFKPQERPVVENSSYTIIRTRMSQREAQLYCQQRNERLGTFITYESAKRMSYLLHFISEPYTPEYDLKHRAVEFGLDRRYWIGLTDVNMEDEWQWEGQGSYLRYDFWSPGQPDHINNTGFPEHCVVFWNPTYYENSFHAFNDEPCVNKHYFMCERYLPNITLTLTTPAPPASRGRFVEGLGYMIDDENSTLPYGVTILEFDESNSELCKAVLNELHRRLFDAKNSSSEPVEEKMDDTTGSEEKEKRSVLGHHEITFEKRDASGHHEDSDDDEFNLRNITVEEIEAINSQKCRRFPGRSFYGRSFHGHVPSNQTNITDQTFEEFNQNASSAEVSSPRRPVMTGRGFMGRRFNGDINDLEVLTPNPLIGTDQNINSTGTQEESTTSDAPSTPRIIPSGRRFLGRSFGGKPDSSEDVTSGPPTTARRKFGRTFEGESGDPEISTSNKVYASGRRFLGRGFEKDSDDVETPAPETTTIRVNTRKFGRTFEGKPDSSEMSNLKRENANIVELEERRLDGQNQSDMLVTMSQNITKQRSFGRGFTEQTDTSMSSRKNESGTFDGKKVNSTAFKTNTTKIRKPSQPSNTKIPPESKTPKGTLNTKPEGAKNIRTLQLPKNKGSNKITQTILKFIP